MTGPHETPAVSPVRVKTTAAVLTGAGLAGALTYIALLDPHRPGSPYPPCLFRALTGWNCPACGGLRMTHDVLHGHLLEAVHDNVFALVLIPLLTVGVLAGRRLGWRVRSSWRLPCLPGRNC